MSDPILVPVQATGAESILGVNKALDELESKLSGLGRGTASNALSNLESQVKAFKGTMSSFQGVGASAVSELTNLRNQLKNVIESLIDVLAKNVKGSRGNPVDQYLQMAIDLDVAFEKMTAAVVEGSNKMRIAEQAAAVQRADAAAKAVLEQKRQTAMMKSAMAEAQSQLYTPYNASTVATYATVDPKKQLEQQANVDAQFLAAQEAFLNKQLSLEIAGYAKLAEAELAAREKQLQTDAIFYGTQEDFLAKSLRKELDMIAAQAAEAISIKEAESNRMLTILGRTAAAQYTQASKPGVAGTYSIATGAGIGNVVQASSGLEAAAAATARLNNEAVKASSGLKALSLDLNDAHSAARGLASGFDAMFLTWGNILPLLAGAAISHTFMEALKAGSEVVSTLGAIGSLADGTAEDIQKLNVAVLQLGANSQFGPVELSKALKTLALAGVNTKDSLIDLQSVMAFSVVGEMPVQKAAESLVAISTAFGYTAKDISMVGDVIAKTAAMSMADVDGMTQSFRTASTVAQQYGVSLNDAALNLAFLSQIGIKGTAAGTAMKNMYQSLEGVTNKAAKAIKTLGVEMHDSSGAFLSMDEIIPQLSEKLGQYNAKSQQQFLADLANNRGAKDLVAAMQAYRTKLYETSPAIAAQIASLEEQGKLIDANALRTKLATSVAHDYAEQIKQSAGFVFTGNAESSILPQNQFAQIKAALETDLVNSFKIVEDQIYNLGDAVKAVFRSEAFTEGLAKITQGVTYLATKVVENIGVIYDLGKAFLVLQGAMLAPTAIGLIVAGFESLVTVMSTAALGSLSFALNLGQMAKALAVATFATVETAEATTALAVATKGFMASLGPIAMLLTAAGLAWAFFGDSASKAQKDMEEAAKATQNRINDYNTSLEASIKNLEDVAEARRSGSSLEELQIKRQSEAQVTRINQLEEMKNKTLELAAANYEVLASQIGVDEGTKAGYQTKIRDIQDQIEANKQLARDQRTQNAELTLRATLLAQANALAANANKVGMGPVGTKENGNGKDAMSKLNADIQNLKGQIKVFTDSSTLAAKQFLLDQANAAALAVAKVNDYTQFYTEKLNQIKDANTAVFAAQAEGTLGEAAANKKLADLSTLQYQTEYDQIVAISKAKQDSFQTQEEAADKAWTTTKNNLEKELYAANQILDLEKQKAGVKAAGNGSTTMLNGIEEAKTRINELKQKLDEMGESSKDSATAHANYLAELTNEYTLLNTLTQKQIDGYQALTQANLKSQIADNKASENIAKTTKQIDEQNLAILKVAADYAAMELAMELASEAANGFIDPEKINLLVAALDAAVSAVDAAASKIRLAREVSTDWLSAAVKALNTYRDGLDGIAKAVSDLATGSLGKLEDAFTNMLVHGKLSFKDLADYAIQQIARIVAQQIFVKPLLGALFGDGNSSGSSSGSGGGLMSSLGLVGTGNSLYNSYKTGSGVFSLFGGSSTAASGSSALTGSSIYAGETLTSSAGGIYEGATAASSYGGAAVAADSGAAAAGGSSALAGEAASAGPYGWIAAAVILAISYLTAGNGGIPTKSTGDSNASFDSQGNITSQNVFGAASWNPTPSENSERMVAALEKSYLDAAAKLHIGTVASNFSYSGNTGENSQHPNFGLGGAAGSSSFYSGETTLDDAGLQLASSKAVLAALKGSDLPKWLSGIFDDIDISKASQQDIDNLMAAAQAVDDFHTAVAKLPFDSLKNLDFKGIQGLTDAAGGLSNLQTLLNGFFDKYFTDAEKAAASTDNVAAVFQDIGIAVPATMADFRKVVEDSFNDTSREGEATSIKLLGVADAFATLHASTTTAIADVKALSAAMVTDFNNAQTAVTNAQTALGSAIDAAKTHMTDLESALADAQSAMDTVVGNIKSAYSSAQDKVTAAQTKLNSLLQQSAAQMTTFTKSLKDFLNTLDTTTLGSGNPETIYNANKALFQTTAAKAAGGDTTAINDLASVAKQFLETSKDYNATNAQFASDVDMVRSQVSGVATYTQSKSGDSTADSLDAIAQAQQDLADAQTELNAINDVIKETGIDVKNDVHDYLKEWQTAQHNLTVAQTNLDKFHQLVDNYLGNTLTETQLQTQILNDILAAQNGLANALLNLNSAEKPLDKVVTDANGMPSYTSSGGATATVDKGTGAITVTGTTGQSASLSDVKAYVSALRDQGDLLGLYNFAAKQGLSSITLSQLLDGQVSAANIQDWVKTQGLPALPGVDVTKIKGLATGGVASSGWAWTGEDGPELINFTNPARVYNSSDSAEMSGGSAKMEALQMHNERMALQLETANRHAEQTNTLLRAATKKLDNIDRSQRLNNSKPQSVAKAK